MSATAFPDASEARESPQPALFEKGEWWEEHWRGMPEFVQRDLSPHKTLEVLVRSEEDYAAFERLAGKIYHGKWLWWPNRGYGRWRDWYYAGPPDPPRYPVYIISKGRWKTPLTARSLERMGVPYRIVVEPQEADFYRVVVEPERVLVLPFSNLGQGSIPARNFVWEHALAAGAKRHWILDDNIDGFYRLNRNVKLLVLCPASFRAAEDFADRFKNVALAAMQYESFAMRRAPQPPFVLNTRCYSAILIDSSLPFRWRGRYNEDTDLSLRALKSGACTVLFNAFLANKIATMRMAGGNTDELYRQDGEFDGRLEMARSLQEQHPDVVKITRKWGRWQHHVDYTGFERNKLRPRGTIDASESNEYGMVLKARKDGDRGDQGQHPDPSRTDGDPPSAARL